MQFKRSCVAVWVYTGCSSLLKMPNTCNIFHRRCKNTALHLWLHATPRPWLHTTPNVLFWPNPWLQQHTRTSPLLHSAWSALQGQGSAASAHQWILHTSSLVVILLFWADQSSSNNINLSGQSTRQGLKEKALWSHPSTHKNALNCALLAHLCNQGRADTTHRAWISSFSSGLSLSSKHKTIFLTKTDNRDLFSSCCSLSCPHFTA